MVVEETLLLVLRLGGHMVAFRRGNLRGANHARGLLQQKGATHLPAPLFKDRR